MFELIIIALVGLAIIVPAAMLLVHSIKDYYKTATYQDGECDEIKECKLDPPSKVKSSEGGN